MIKTSDQKHFRHPVSFTGCFEESVAKHSSLLFSSRDEELLGSKVDAIIYVCPLPELGIVPVQLDPVFLVL